MTNAEGFDMDEKAQKRRKLHMGVAEQGKLYALEENYPMALAHYQQAVHLCVQGKDPEVFFRHYLECIMEVMEQDKNFDKVLDYCNKAIEHYGEGPAPNAFATKDQAYIHQKKGIILLKMGNKEEAKESLQKSIDIMSRLDQEMPLAKVILNWIKRGMQIDDRRLLSEQKKHAYFQVRKETVDADKAIHLPKELIRL